MEVDNTSEVTMFVNRNRQTQKYTDPSNLCIKI